VRILVTGGAGFIGSHVVDRFVEAGHEVSVVDNLATGDARWVNPRARLHVVDLRSARLAEVFEQARPEVVAHLAAQASVGRSVTDPVFDASVNVVGGLGLLDCCRRFGVRRIIYSSSGGAGYGDTDVIPTPETHPTLPISPYGITKVAMEYYVNAWSGIFGISGISLRYANIYGPRQNPQGEAGVIAIFCHRLLTGQAPSPPASNTLKPRCSIPFSVFIFGMILYIADKLSRKRKEISDMSLLDCLVIGISQALAIIPGVSRSGITIIGGLARNLKRETAARFSFLLSTPLIAGAAILESRHLDYTAVTSVPFVVGILTAAVFGFLAIKYLLRYVQTNSYTVFVIYRIMLAALILFVYMRRVGG